MAVITIRRADRCRRCGVSVHVGQQVEWSRGNGVRCLTDCAPPPSSVPTTDGVTAYAENPPTVREGPAGWPDPGRPGGSAMREFERRAAAERETRRRSWPRRLPAAVVIVGLCTPAALTIGPAALVPALIIASLVVLVPMWAGPSSGTQHYRTGAVGERRVAQVLDHLVQRKRELSIAAATLHDRCIPGREENIDHLIITATGVTVIETKNWSGTLRLWRGRWYAAQKSSVDRAAGQATRQAKAVCKALRASRHGDVEVRSIVCLSGQAQPRHPFRIDDVTVCGPSHLWGQLSECATDATHDVRSVAHALARELPPA